MSVDITVNTAFQKKKRKEKKYVQSLRYQYKSHLRLNYFSTRIYMCRKSKGSQTSK